MGDFNAQVAEPHKDTVSNCYSYVGVQDRSVNNHGRKLINLCKNNSLMVANHLSYSGTTLGGDCSYRQGKRWVAELDLCLVKHKNVPMIKKLVVIQGRI